MRSHPASYCLSFLLPADYRLTYAGPQPAAFGCEVQILQAISNMVSIIGPSREVCFDAAAWLLRTVHNFTGEPVSVTATLATPSGTDTWSIAVGAEVAFAPTSLGHQFPRAAAR